MRASPPLSRSSVFAVSTQEKGKKILLSTDTDLLLADPLPPYLPTMRPAQVAPLVAQASPSAPLASPESQGPLGSGGGEGPAAGTRSWKARTPDVLVLPLRAYGPVDEQGNQPLQYLSSSASDLYNWKTHSHPRLYESQGFK